MNKLLQISFLVAFCIAIAASYDNAGSGRQPNTDNDLHELDDGPETEDTLDVPVAVRWCTASYCLSLCRSLGFPNGYCVNANNCRCWR